jgi:hypothetical protein
MAWNANAKMPKKPKRGKALKQWLQHQRRLERAAERKAEHDWLAKGRWRRRRRTVACEWEAWSLAACPLSAGGGELVAVSSEAVRCVLTAAIPSSVQPPLQLFRISRSNQSETPVSPLATLLAHSTYSSRRLTDQSGGGLAAMALRLLVLSARLRIFARRDFLCASST